MTFFQILSWFTSYQPVSAKMALLQVSLQSIKPLFLFDHNTMPKVVSFARFSWSSPLAHKLHEGKDLWVLFTRIPAPRMQ